MKTEIEREDAEDAETASSGSHLRDLCDLLFKKRNGGSLPGAATTPLAFVLPTYLDKH